MNAFFFPRLHKVEALAPYNLRTWSTGEVLDVDVESALCSNPALCDILAPSVFALVHMASGAVPSSGRTANLVQTTSMPRARSRRVKRVIKCFATGCSATTSRKMRLPQPLGYPLALCVATLRHKAPSPAVSGLPALAGRP